MKIKFQSLFISFLVLFVLNGCAALGPAGTWEYSVTDTPEGDFYGNMVIEKSGDEYTGYLFANDAKIEFNELTVGEHEIEGTFYYQGNLLQLTGEISDESFTGQINADYESYPMKAYKISD